MFVLWWNKFLLKNTNVCKTYVSVLYKALLELSAFARKMYIYMYIFMYIQF